MAGNPHQDLNLNPFLPSVQLHRTPQALTWSTTSTATQNASVADKDMSNGMRTEVNDPLMLGGSVPASAMAFPGERSQQNLILAPQEQAVPDPFCLSSTLPTSRTRVRQAESDHSNENSIFDMGSFAAAQSAAVQQHFGLISDLPVSMNRMNLADQSTRMVLPSTGSVIPSMISGHKEIDQQNPMDADTSFLASGYNYSASGPDRPSMNQDDERELLKRLDAREAWARDGLRAGGTDPTCSNFLSEQRRSEHVGVPGKHMSDYRLPDNSPFKSPSFKHSPSPTAFKLDSMLQPYATDDDQRNASIASYASDSNEDQSKKTAFDAFVIKSPNPDAHGPMSYSIPGKEDQIDLIGEVTVLTDTLTPVSMIKQEFTNHPSFSHFISKLDDDIFHLELQKAIDTGVLNPQGAFLLSNRLSETFCTATQAMLNEIIMPMIIDSVRSTIKSQLPEHIDIVEKLCGLWRVERPNLKSIEQQHVPLLNELENICTGLVFWEDKKKQLVLELSGIGANQMSLLSGASLHVDAKTLDVEITECTSTMKILRQAMVAKICDFAHRAQPNKPLNMRDIKLPAGLKGDSDAKIARQLCDNILDFFMQNTELFYPLIFVHVTLRDLLFVEGQLVIPPSERDQAYGKTLHLPENFKKIYDDVNQTLGAQVRAKFEDLSQASRAGRKFDYGGKGRSVFIIGDNRDGMSALWYHVVRHAEKTHQQCLQTRDRLQHAGGLFVSGPIKNSIGTVRKDIELATSLNILIEPTSVIFVTLKNLANRHQAFMGLYNEAKRTEHTMTLEQGVEFLDIYMTKIEDTAREFSLFEKNISSANLADSKIQESESKAFYSTSSSSPTVSPGASTDPQEAMICFAQGCNEQVGAYAVKGHISAMKKYPESTKPKPVCTKCFNTLLMGEGKVKITHEDGSKLEYDKQRHEKSLLRLKRQPKHASNAVAAPKTAPKADEEELIELKKQNADLRGQLDEKEKTGSQQGQLNQIAQMLMDSRTAKVAEVKTRRVKDANEPPRTSG